MFYNTRLGHSFKENSTTGEKEVENKDSYLSLNGLKKKLQEIHGNKKSKNVYVISCYYSVNAIQSLFDSLSKRKVSLVVSALGHSQEKIEEIIEDLKRVKKNRNKKIFVCTEFPLLHTKIYYSEVKRVDGANCLVGSSNLSENGFANNEEILVDVDDVEIKKKIRAYIKSIIDKSIDIDDYNGCGGCASSRNDFMSFASSGYIVFKPNNQIQLNYSGDPLRKIAQNLNNEVENGNQNSELSIDLKNYIVNKDYLNFKINTDIKSGARIKDHCVETCFGFWLPSGRHHDALNERDDDEIKKFEEQIDRIIGGLKKIDVSSDSFKSYIEKFYSSIKNGIQSVVIPENLKSEILSDVEKFVSRQIKYLENRKSFLAKGFLITPMPYFWDDTCAAHEFYDSFWENIESRKHRGVARELWDYFENDYLNKNWTTLVAKENKKWE